MLRYSYSKKVKIQQIMFYLNLGIFICCAAYLFNYYYQGYKGESKIDDLRSIMEQYDTEVNNDISVNHSVDITDDEDTGEREILSSYKKARAEEYPYLVGRIIIEDTPIDYYVMQTPEDPEYFLRKDVTGEYNFEGTPFIDANCDISKPSNNLIIYAHAMKNKHQFGTLRYYCDKKYYEEHPVIKFETMYETMCEYDIVAAFYSQLYNTDEEDVFRYYYFYGTENEQEFDYYIDNIKELSCYDTGITPQFGDQLITLSTCNNQVAGSKNGRFVVVARKRVETEDKDDTKDNDKKQNATQKPESTKDVNAATKSPEKSTAEPKKTSAPKTTKKAAATAKPTATTKPKTTKKPAATSTVAPTKKPTTTSTPEDTKKPSTTKNP